jgi:hypothetical protein
LFAEWHLNSQKVEALAAGERFSETRDVKAEIEVPNDWFALVASDPNEALRAQARLRKEFETAFAAGLVARGFARDEHHPRYLLY